MKFVIMRKGIRPAPVYLWELQKKDGEAVCGNANALSTEAEARSDIAQAKVSMKAARFAKVEVAS